MPSAPFETLLTALRHVHQGNAALRAFCDFPDDLVPHPLTPRPLPCAEVLTRQGGLAAGPYGALRDAMIAAGPVAHWRDTYAGTGLGAEFMDRFGCYCIIGPSGAWDSAVMNAWIIAMPADFWYPWHQHPAEEMYFVVAGEAEFLRRGEPPETLGPGDTVGHDSDQPHAMRTGGEPVLACAIWRNHFGIRPVLTPEEGV